MSKTFFDNIVRMMDGKPIRINPEDVAVAAEKFVVPFGYKRVTKLKLAQAVFAKELSDGYACVSLYTDNRNGDITSVMFYRNDEIYKIESEHLMGEVKSWDRAIFFGKPRGFHESGINCRVKYSNFWSLGAQIKPFFANFSEVSKDYELFCNDLQTVFDNFKKNTMLSQILLATTLSRLLLAISLSVYLGKTHEINSIINNYKSSTDKSIDLERSLDYAKILVSSLKIRGLIDADQFFEF